MNQKDISGPLKNLESSAAAADISKSQSCDIFNNQALTKQLVCQNNFFFQRIIVSILCFGRVTRHKSNSSTTRRRKNNFLKLSFARVARWFIFQTKKPN
jgi:hypothetical protein